MQNQGKLLLFSILKNYLYRQSEINVKIKGNKYEIMKLILWSFWNTCDSQYRCIWTYRHSFPAHFSTNKQIGLWRDYKSEINESSEYKTTWYKLMSYTAVLSIRRLDIMSAWIFSESGLEIFFESCLLPNPGILSRVFSFQQSKKCTQLVILTASVTSVTDHSPLYWPWINNGVNYVPLWLQEFSLVLQVW